MTSPDFDPTDYLSEPEAYRSGLHFPPHIVRKLKEINAGINFQMVLYEVWYWSNMGKDCFYAKKTFATKLGIHEKTVRRLIKSGLELGLLINNGWKGSGNRRVRRIKANWNKPVFKKGFRGDIHAPPRGDIHAPLVLNTYNNTPALPSRRERKTKTKGRTMPFSGEETALKIHKKDLERADDLRNAISLKGVHLAKRWSRNSWAKKLGQLRSDLSDLPRLKKVFRWYLDHIGEKYVPHAFCADAFRKKFIAIEKAMQRNLKDNPEVTLTKDAKRIVENIEGIGWPKGSKADLPVVVQLSLDHIKDWWERITLLGELDKKWTSTVEWVQGTMYDQNAFVATWMRKVHDRVANWDKWNGKLTDWAFKEDHKMFTEMGRGWMRERCGDPKRWDELMEQING